MDIPATAAIWLVVMAVLSLGGALGGVAAVYFADKHLGGRPGSKHVPADSRPEASAMTTVDEGRAEYEAAA